MTAIVTLPLPDQLMNGTTADATQVMADLNAIANNVNANVPTAITTALQGVTSFNSGGSQTNVSEVTNPIGGATNIKIATGDGISISANSSVTITLTVPFTAMLAMVACTNTTSTSNVIPLSIYSIDGLTTVTIVNPSSINCNGASYIVIGY